ncbi:MAG: hypothetical protein M3377_09680 [Actinomycetota bacterium]|nr:hypothetical protein [Actinomycetota bacterium]
MRGPVSEATMVAMWRRAQPAEPAIYRDEVLDIIDALVDIKAGTFEILGFLRGDEDEGQDDA